MAKPPESDFWRDLGPKRLHLSAELLSFSPLPESMVLRFGPGKAVEEPEVNQPLGFCLGEEWELLLGLAWVEAGCFSSLVISPLGSFSLWSASATRGYLVS